ncbi:hypothetical protein OX284_013995 [Flavobacterium sp. SUN046]|uniref:DUF6913 domain-containing protein n=1 Tax=Flavobacterium sp. SUN046 TaxID=3002440 RepID=UPI002DBCA580|nr:hypothetical protein [Flavobacterium sp. SUN046]MEC4050548.1 hypothetical protein [Flavobacterium sp. SUN046]
MFLDKIKDFFVKKIVKKSLSNVNHVDSNDCIKTVGVLVDESYFFDKQELINELIKNGIKEEDVQILVFKDKVKKNDVFEYLTFSYKDISWTGVITNVEVLKFIDIQFDLLLNYYDTDKAALLITSNHSKSKFKVGFSTVDKRINHFMIDTNAENYKIFAEELFKYLKILNKI